MTRSEFTITPNTKTDLERERVQLEAEITQLRERHRLVILKLEAIPLFLSDTASISDVNGTQAREMPLPLRPPTGPVPVPTSGEGATEPDPGVSVPDAVKQAIASRGRLEPIEIREAIIQAGIPRERLGSYLYTVLSRMVERGTIQKRGKKYQLPAP